MAIVEALSIQGGVPLRGTVAASGGKNAAVAIIPAALMAQPDTSGQQILSRDARLLAQYLWQPYLDTPVTEYQQFLWQKITQLMQAGYRVQ